MATIQVRVDDNMKAAVDSLFSSLGLDTSTAVRMFLSSALDNRGIPFDVKKTASNTGWSESYNKKVMSFCDTPDPTFVKHAAPGVTDKGGLFV